MTLVEREEKWIRKIQHRQSAKEADLLVRAYYDEIYIYVYRQIGEKESSMDLTQEIFISTLRSIINYNKSKSSFRTWLYRIATNKIIDYRRKYRPTIIALDDVDLPDEFDFVQQSADRQLLKAIDTYVSTLDLHIQQVFRLRIYQNYTFPEIALELELPESTVKTQYHRLIQKLRKEFYDEYSNAD